MTPPVRRRDGFKKEQNKNILSTEQEETAMAKRAFLTGLVELMGLCTLFGVLGVWSIALAPIR